MDLGAHQIRNRVVHQPVASEGRKPCKARRGDAHPEMPALARAGVAGVQGAVVVQFEPGGGEGTFEPLAQKFESVFAHGGVSGVGGSERPRYTDCATTKTRVIAVMPNTLNFTQSACERLNATHRLAAPMTA